MWGKYIKHGLGKGTVILKFNPYWVGPMGPHGKDVVRCNNVRVYTRVSLNIIKGDKGSSVRTSIRNQPGEVKKYGLTPQVTIRRRPNRREHLSQTVSRLVDTGTSSTLDFIPTDSRREIFPRRQVPCRRIQTNTDRLRFMTWTSSLLSLVSPSPFELKFPTYCE